MSHFFSHKQSNDPLVSVVIPVYNGIPYIKDTLESVLQSTYQNLEVILVDDGSSDASKKLCAKYASEYAHVSFIDFPKNLGMDRALNTAIKNAKGEYIARINQDDIMESNRIEKQVAFLEQNREHTAVGGQIVLFTNDNPFFDYINFPLTDVEIKKKWMVLSPFSDPTVMFRKSAFLQTTGYSQYFWPADDVHMWYMLGKIGKLANLDDIVTKVRWHEGAGSIKSHKRQMKKTWAVHMWAAEHIQKPSIKDVTFWVCEYVAGVVFPPKFNWFIYRLIRKVLKRFYIVNKSVNEPVKKTAQRLKSAFAH